MQVGPAAGLVNTFPVSKIIISLCELIDGLLSVVYTVWTIHVERKRHNGTQETLRKPGATCHMLSRNLASKIAVIMHKMVASIAKK